MSRLRYLVVAAMSAVLSTGLRAQTVTYTTTGSQLCVGSGGCGVASQTIGGGTGVVVSFNAVGSLSVNANPSTIGSLGALVMSCVGGGTACGSQSLAGLNLFINITQTSPSAGLASFTGGVISGSVSGTASSATITWSVPNARTIGDVTYSILNNPLGLVPPSVNQGVTPIDATITNNSTVVPEPSTYALMGAGLATMFGVARRRRQA